MKASINSQFTVETEQIANEKDRLRACFVCSSDQRNEITSHITSKIKDYKHKPEYGRKVAEIFLC